MAECALELRHSYTNLWGVFEQPQHKWKLIAMVLAQMEIEVQNSRNIRWLTANKLS